MNPTPISELCDALRKSQFDAKLVDDGRHLVVTLPSSLDQVVLTPSQSTDRPRLFWQHRTFLDTATGQTGYLDWPSEPSALVRHITQYAYSVQQVAPQYRPVLNTLLDRGLTGDLTWRTNGHAIRIGLPDRTFLLIGAGKVLPPRRQHVQGWRVEHYGLHNGLIAVVYDSMPANVALTGRFGGADYQLMADHVARYVSNITARYGGCHPMGGVPALHQSTTAPGTVAWLLDELVRLPHHQERLSPTSGALITIASPDGSDETSVKVPGQVLNRLSALLLTEVTMCQAYG